MKRKKKTVLLAHCFLNVNAKVEGIATETGGCTAIVSGLLQNGFGIIQLPCVEQSCFGIQRWGQVKEQLDFPGFRNKAKALLQPIVEQLVDFKQNGYEICAVIGLDGSPACGVNYTCSADDWGGEIGEGHRLPEHISAPKRLAEAGVMMEVLREMLAEAHLDVKFLAVDESDPETAAEALLKELCK